MGTAMVGPSVTSRVVAVLATFTEHNRLLTLSEIARRSGLPLTTTHRLVGELAGGGLLERDGDNRYRIGLRLWEIASSAPRSVDLREAAIPFLEDLYEASHENVQLAVMDRGEAVYVERLAGRDSVHVVTRPGSRLPLHATGVGLVLLAHASHETQEQVLGAPLKRYTCHTVTDPRRLRSMLCDVRRDGYAVSDRQIETISVSVAAPIRGPDNQVLAAISIVIDAARGDPRVLVPAVVSAARGISRRVTAWR
jgi:DNA-binding IclR family transcriptional regulator